MERAISDTHAVGARGIDEHGLAALARVSALSGVLGEALGRWSAAARRLGLDAAAAECGALLLGAELDLDVSRELLGAHAERVAPRRVDLLHALGAKRGRDLAFAALASLEARGVALPLPSHAGPFLLAELTLARPVREHCMGATASSPAPAAIVAYPRLARALENVVRRSSERPEAHLVAIRGSAGSGRDACLGELARRLRVRPLVKSVFELRQALDPLEPELSDRASVWDARRADPGPDDRDIARRWLARSQTLCFALLDPHQDTPDVEGRLVSTIEVDARDLDERRHVWSVALSNVPASPAARSAAAEHLASRNQAGAGLACRAAALDDAPPAESPLALAKHVEHALSQLVQPSAVRGICVEHPDRSLEAVVAPARVKDALDRLRMLCASHMAVSARGRHGVKALFTGPSGTGKTLAARALARSIGQPLYRVDLATLVSKWVGETEKNLRDALAAAAAVGAVLLFDEGDALFGKRGDIEKGTDRYANLEVSYLLQAIESYESIAVVTTNRRASVDKAFERRFDACIDFCVPESDERARIWRQELGAAGGALSPAFVAQLSRRAELSGGHIAAAARIARVLAHQRGESQVSSEDVQLAVQAEFLKQGSTVKAHHWTDGGPDRARG